MLTRDKYIAILEKRAADDIMPAPVDSQEEALKDRAANMSDNREYLGGLFKQTDSVEKQESRQAGKLFPGKSEKESGHVLMKVAFHQGIEETWLMKEASPAYREVAFHAFCSELEKIGGPLPTQTMGQLATKNSVGQGFGKVHDLSRMAGAMGVGGAAAAAKPAESPATAALRQHASSLSASQPAAKPGILQRAMGAIGIGR